MPKTQLLVCRSVSIPKLQIGLLTLATTLCSLQLSSVAGAQSGDPEIQIGAPAPASADSDATNDANGTNEVTEVEVQSGQITDEEAAAAAAVSTQAPAPSPLVTTRQNAAQGQPTNQARVVVVKRQSAPNPTQVVHVSHERPAPERKRRFGFRAQVSSVLSSSVRMGGLTAGFRFRPIDFFALDVSVGAYAGKDYDGRERFEIPTQLDAVFFFNPKSRFQFYSLIGPGVSYAHTSGFNDTLGRTQPDREFTYISGNIGLGAEWRPAPCIGFNLELRGFLRKRTDDDGAPEYINANTGEGTNHSAGALMNLGFTVYF